MLVWLEPQSIGFWKKEIICPYGIPERIISDNTANQNNKMISEWCEQVKIRHYKLDTLSSYDE